MKNSMKENASLILSAGGFIFGLISVIGWLGISPDTVGQKMYDFLLIVLPIIVFASGALTGVSLYNVYAKHVLGMPAKEAAKKLIAQQKRIEELESDKPPVVDGDWVRAACKLLSDAQKAELYQAYLIGEGFNPNYEGFRSAGKLTSCRLLQKHGLQEYDVHPAAVQAIDADESLKKELIQAWEGSRLAS